MHLKACRRRFSQREAHKPEAERCPLLEEDDARSRKGHQILSMTPSLDIILDVNSPLPPPTNVEFTWVYHVFSNQKDKPVIMKMDTQHWFPLGSLGLNRVFTSMSNCGSGPGIRDLCVHVVIKKQSSTVMAKGETSHDWRASRAHAAHRITFCLYWKSWGDSQGC